MKTRKSLKNKKAKRMQKMERSKKATPITKRKVQIRKISIRRERKFVNSSKDMEVTMKNRKI
jgi:hypothetical protein